MKYVYLTTADDYLHAHSLSAALETEGIPCIEANENTSTLLPHLRQGIDIRVKETDYLRAKVICERVEEMRRLRCPSCDSTSVKYVGLEPRPLTLFETVLKILHIPVSTQRLIYVCSECKNTFKIR